MRRLLSAIGWLLGIVLLGLAVLFGINATDEPLSEEAQALLRRPPPPAPSEKNGYIDFLALGAPANAPTHATGIAQLDALNRGAYNGELRVAIDPRVRQCERGHILACAAANPWAKEVVDSHAVFLARYRTMREKPEFIDLQVPPSPYSFTPAYQDLVNGQRLSLLHAALEFNAGRRAEAVRELEAEFAFYRTMAAGSRTLLPKMMAFALLDGAALFASELARSARTSDKELWRRLETLLRAPTSAELDVLPALNHERAQFVDWMRTRRYVRLSDADYENLKAAGLPLQRPWWDPVAPWLYRPNYSVNKFAAQTGIMLTIAERPAREFRAALPEYRARAAALEPPQWKRLLVSPAATFNYYFAEEDYSDYVGRMYGFAGMQALVGLQIRLRAAGITKPADVARALAGPLGNAYPDPFTGTSMEFDQEKMTIGFACEVKYLTGVARGIAGQGKVALPL